MQIIYKSRVQIKPSSHKQKTLRMWGLEKVIIYYTIIENDKIMLVIYNYHSKSDRYKN